MQIASMDNIQISYAHGAGGAWLATVLHYCVTPNVEWLPRPINFHKQRTRQIKNSHGINAADNILSIGNGDYKYNFWRLYVFKRFLYELNYKRVRGMREVICPYDNYIDPRDDFFWVINQCRYIQSYHCPGNFQIDWKDLFYNPEKPWDTICKFFEHNQIKNYRNIDDFLIVLNNYKNTCSQINFNINFKNKLFKIWALSFLQNNNHVAPADVFENFEHPVIDDWILSNKNLILDYTNGNCIEIN